MGVRLDVQGVCIVGELAEWAECEGRKDGGSDKDLSGNEFTKSRLCTRPISMMIFEQYTT